MSHRLLVIADSHLSQSRSTHLFGVDTYQALSITTKQIMGLQSNCDLLVALGDLSQDGSPQSYQDFDALTSSLADSVIWVKGNHDNFDNFENEQYRSYCKSEWHLDPWHLIFLDTTLRGKDEGLLQPGELERLKEFLVSYRERHIMIFMHHQPVLVGSAFIDELALQNREQFLRLVSGSRSVRAIIFGHVHQQMDEMYKGIRMLSVPAASMQFRPNSEHLDFDRLQHGYRVLTLSPDGQFGTSVEMVNPE